MKIQSQKDKYHFIDSLRGVAILMVILVHTSQSITGISSIVASISKYGQMGVQLFFFLSAYTLCLSMSRNIEYKNKILTFYIRRYFRIAPLYYFGIVMYFFVAFILKHYSETIQYFGYRLINGPPYTLSNILANLFFVHNIYLPAYDKIVPGGWSIGAEMIFYFIFPYIFFVYFNIKNYKTYIFLLIPTIVFIVSFIMVRFLCFKYNLEMGNNKFMYFNILNQIPVFCVGITFYFIHVTRKDYTVKLSTKMLFFLFAFFTLLSFYVFNNLFYITVVPFLSSISFAFLFLLFERIKILNNKLVIKIGQLSYSMYIFHFLFSWPISEFIYKKTGGILSPNLILLVCLLINVGATMLLAQLTFKTIETHGIQFGQLIIKRFNSKVSKG